MPNYTVTFFDTYTVAVEHIVEAETEEGARDLAEELHKEDTTQPTMDDFDEWEFGYLKEIE